jgi:hypothetical protein
MEFAEVISKLVQKNFKGLEKVRNSQKFLRDRQPRVNMNLRNVHRNSPACELGRLSPALMPSSDITAIYNEL